MDRGAWRATVHGVTKSQKWLNDFHSCGGASGSLQQSHIHVAFCISISLLMNLYIPFDPEILILFSFLGFYHKDTVTKIQNNESTRVFMVVLFVTEKCLKPKYPSVVEWLNKLKVYLHSRVLYNSKKNGDLYILLWYDCHDQVLHKIVKCRMVCATCYLLCKKEGKCKYAHTYVCVFSKRNNGNE